MTLFCLLCVCLVLVGWTVRREVRAALRGMRLWLFGARVRVGRPPEPPAARRSAAPPPGPPPFGVATRPGP
jgi:hypothetical protein